MFPENQIDVPLPDEQGEQGEKSEIMPLGQEKEQQEKEQQEKELWVTQKTKAELFSTAEEVVEGVDNPINKRNDPHGNLALNSLDHPPVVIG